MNQAINAIKDFYKEVLGIREEIENLSRPRKIHQLPDVLSSNEIVRVIDVLDNLKHRVVLLLT